jgi:protein SCO1
MYRLLTAACLCLILASPMGASSAAHAATYNGKDISAERIGGRLDLTDQNGKRHSLEDFRGKVVLIFFGYTRCPDVCPTTLLRMAQVMKLLGPSASKVQVLWVTVDPERDTPELLRNYVPGFDKSFLALRGTPAQTETVAKNFRIMYQILNYKGTILVDHSAFGYLIDTGGKTRLRLPYDMTAEQIAADVRAFLPQESTRK